MRKCQLHVTIDIVILSRVTELLTKQESVKFFRLILIFLVSIAFASPFVCTDYAFAQTLNSDYLLGSHKLDQNDSQIDVVAPSVLLSIRPAAEVGKEKERAKPKYISQGQPVLKPDIDDADAHFGLSDETYNLAKIWGLLPSLATLRKTPKNFSTGQVDSALRRIIIQQEVTEDVLSKMFDIRTTLNAIDRQVAKSQEIRAVLAEKRDKAIRFNTYADFVAGGITGILSSALRLGTLDFVTPDVVDVVEGVTQAGLAGMAFKNENIEHHIEKGIPNLLAKLFYPNQKKSMNSQIVCGSI